MGQELLISMHAISSIASAAKTFPLFVTIGSMKLVALIDSGSSTTFIDPSVIVKANLPVHNHEPIKVTVANGSTLWTQAITPSYQYSIQGHDFTTNFRVLNLEGYDLILGCE
jgi:short subunit fatty acids transporter